MLAQVIIHEEGKAILKVESGTTLEVLKLLYETQHADNRTIIGVRPSKRLNDIPCIVTLNETKLEHGDYDIIVKDQRYTPPLSPTYSNNKSPAQQDEDNNVIARCIDCSRESWKTKRYTSIGMNTEVSINPNMEVDSIRSMNKTYAPPKSDIIHPSRSTRGRPPLQQQRAPIPLHPSQHPVVYTTVNQQDYIVSTLPVLHPSSSNYESEYLERKHIRSRSPRSSPNHHSFNSSQTKICYPFKNNAIDLDLVPYDSVRSSIHGSRVHSRARSPPIRVKMENGTKSPPRVERSNHTISPYHRVNGHFESEIYASRNEERKKSYHHHPPTRVSHYHNDVALPVVKSEEHNEGGPPVYVLPNDFDHTNDSIDAHVIDYSNPKNFIPPENNNNNNDDIAKEVVLGESTNVTTEPDSPASINASDSGKSFSDEVKPEIEMPAPRRYPCKICKETFPTKSTLYKHLRAHPSDEKPFKCNECGQGFTLSSNLRQHRIIHRGYKPFQCEFCGKKFMRSNVYKQHRRIHTGEQMHKCEFCPSEFLQKYALIKHLKKSHNIEHFDH